MMRIAEILRKTSDKVIFVCGSPYHILITVSLIMKADLYGNCALILPAYSQKNIYYFVEEPFKPEDLIFKYTYDYTKSKITHC